MNPIILGIGGRDYVFRYIPAPRGNQYRLFEYPDIKNKEVMVGNVYPFYMAETVICGNDNKPKAMGEGRDKGGMGYNDGIALCRRLTECKYEFSTYTEYEQLVNTNNLFIRLPTEFEWEWAALGGEDFEYPGCPNIDKVAWYLDNIPAPRKKQQVKLKNPNGYGLYDMSGNMRECTANWCEYAHPWRHNDTGSLRVLRGGGWFNDADYARVANRYGSAPSFCGNYLGLRLCFYANPIVLNLIEEKGLMR